MTTLAMTIYDRTPEVINAVFHGLHLPGNQPDTIAVCYDRASVQPIEAFRKEAKGLGCELREAFLTDDHFGPRCPSRAWNRCLNLVKDQSHVFCISSDMIMAPHSIGMAYHLAAVASNEVIVGRTEHCGMSYFWSHQISKDIVLRSRTITSSYTPDPLGFSWLMPMKKFNQIGGFDEIFMEGYCYEDSDFVVRMWRAGVDFIFCDDIMGFHLEHKRDHLKDQDGKVTLNAKVFKERYGDVDYLKERRFPIIQKVAGCMAFWTHEERTDFYKDTWTQQQLYGQDEPWRAIPVEFKPKGGPNL